MEDNEKNERENVKNESSAKKRIKAKIAVISLISILVILIGLQMYAMTSGHGNLFMMIKDWTTTKSENGKDEVLINDEKKEAKVELEIDSKEVKETYINRPAFDENRIQKNAYQTKKVTNETLDDEVLLAYAFNNLELEDSDKTTTVVNGQKLDGWYSFDAEKLHEKELEMYGVTVKDQSFDIGYGKECSYSNGKYSFSSGGGSGESMTNIGTIINAYKENDSLYIEEKYILLKENDNKAALFSASDSDEELATIDVSKYKDEKTMIKEIKEKYSDKMVKYKHTFKKNKHGKYFWYSTEPLKEKSNNDDITTNTISNTTKNPDSNPDFNKIKNTNSITKNNTTSNTTNTFSNTTMDTSNTTNTIPSSTQKLEPDNYAEEVEANEAYDKYLETATEVKASTRIDIDKDGVSELIIGKGTCEADKRLEYYTFKNKKVVSLGELPFGHSAIYEMNNADYLFQVYGQMGAENTEKIYIKDGQIQSETLSSGEIAPGASYALGDKEITDLSF